MLTHFAPSAKLRQSMQIDVEFLNKESLRDAFNLSRPGALRSSRAFEVDPFRLTLKLIRRATEMGLEVFGETEITHLTRRAEGVTLDASSGGRVSARKVIFATGYETMQELPADLCRLSSTYAAGQPTAGEFHGMAPTVFDMGIGSAVFVSEDHGR